MKSKEIYAAIGVLVVIGVLVWWGADAGMARKMTQKIDQEEINKNPTGSINPIVVTDKPVPTFVTNKNLAGTVFRLTTYNGSPVPAEPKITLSFTETNFTLKICNTLSSTYYIDGNVLKVNNLESTLMYCGIPSHVMKIESDASSILNSGNTNIYRSGSTLILSHSSGVVMAFEGF